MRAYDYRAKTMKSLKMLKPFVSHFSANIYLPFTMRTPTNLPLNHLFIAKLLLYIIFCRVKKRHLHMKHVQEPYKQILFCLSFIWQNAQSRRQSHFRPSTVVKRDSFAAQIRQTPTVPFVSAPERHRL